MLRHYLRTALRSLSFKLGVAFALVVLVAVGCMGAYGYVNDRSNAVRRELAELQLFSRELASRIDRTLAYGKGLSGHLARTRDVRDFLGRPDRGGKALETCLEWLDQQMGQTPGLYAVFVMSMDGRCLASSNRSYMGWNFGFRPYFQEAAAGRPAASDWVIGSVTHTPRIFSAAPVMAGGRITGVLVTEFLVDEVDQAVRATGVNGRSVVVINAQGIALSHSNPDYTYHSLGPLDPAVRAELRRTRQFLEREIPADPLSQPFADAFRKTQATGQSQTVSYRLGSSAKWAALSPILERNWVVSVAIPEAEILEPIKLSAEKTLLVGLATTLLSFVLAFVMGRSLLGPIHRLWDAMRRFGAGDAGARAQVEALDERGRLAREFNAMADALQSHRERLEDLVQARTRELSRSEERFRQVVDCADEWIWEVDAQGLFTYASDAVERILGYVPEELVGRLHYYDLFDPGQRESLRARTKAGFDRKAPVRNNPIPHLHKDGRTVFLETSGMPVLDAQGNLAGFRGANKDITERIRAERENALLQAQLLQAQKMESLGSLAGGIAHDMNNVLGAILALASANLESQPADSPARRAFETITQAAVRGGKMVKGLLSFARQHPAEEHQLDLNAILGDEVRLLERSTLSKVRLELDLAPGLRPVRGDAGALTNAFMNLCVNAVDAMPDQGSLLLRTRNLEDGGVEVLVQDTGSGMTPEVLERAPDPFFTTKAVGKGTGLGLSMVYRTVKAHRGQMDIQSEPGRGTRIRMVFPGSAPEAPAPAPAPAHGVERPPLRVLLVDDDELVQRSTQGLLELLGHTVRTVSSGEEALAALDWRPDMVLLDLNMPGLGGAGTLPRLRALLPGVPVLLVTGRTDQAALDLAKAHPRVALLAKPFSKADLRAQLEAMAD